MSSINTKIDLVVSFDTTGSMYPVLTQVRQQVESFVEAMFADFSDLRLGIIAHGDYCDKDNPYTIMAVDLTRDEKQLCKFVREVKSTYGGDADECYELVLNVANYKFSWRDDAEKILLMIGDASPHSPSYTMNKLHLDWREETDKLASNGVKVFAVHALSYYRSSSRAFYKSVAERTLGTYLTLDQFNEIITLIKATCYQQGSEEVFDEYVTIIKNLGMYTHSMENNIKRLRGEEVSDDYRYSSRPSRSYTPRRSGTEAGKIKEMDKLVPVLPGRFQTFLVPENIDIKGYVTSMGIEFKKGRGFYELSKAETVQQYKEVIIQDRETGEMFNGSQVREELGLSPQTEKGGVNERLHKDAAKKYRVFVQSTSVNRKLIAGTTFLYEVSDIEDTGTVIEEDKSMLKDATLESFGEVPKKSTKKSTAKKDTEKKVSKKDTTKKSDKKSEKKQVKGVSEKPKIDKGFEDTASKLVSQSAKVVVAINRYTESQNKKNTAFAKNNLKKLIELAKKLDDKIDE